MNVHKGDTVLVISGKDKGAKGKVLVAFPDRNKILVEGVNRIKKHTKVGQTQRGAKTGGIVVQEAPIHVSNVMPVVEHNGKKVGTRVGFRFDDNGNKIRYAKRTGEDL
jgi:large subunit ribosomal protein L24